MSIDLAAIEAAAYKGFTVRQVAHLVGVPATSFEMHFSEEEHPYTIAYMKSLYQSQSDLREAVINSALSGSSPAQTEMRKNLDAAMVSLKIALGQ